MSRLLRNCCLLQVGTWLWEPAPKPAQVLQVICAYSMLQDHVPEWINLLTAAGM